MTEQDRRDFFRSYAGYVSHTHHQYPDSPGHGFDSVRFQDSKSAQQFIRDAQAKVVRDRNIRVTRNLSDFVSLPFLAMPTVLRLVCFFSFAVLFDASCRKRRPHSDPD